MAHRSVCVCRIKEERGKKRRKEVGREKRESKQRKGKVLTLTPS